MIPQLNTALTFANNNFKVFPLKCNSKAEQILKSWKNEASTDINQIHDWFENTNHNIAITTGNGLVVIDVDVKHSQDGMNKIKELWDKIPNTLTVRTPSGGLHLYYLVNHHIKNYVGLYNEIDIRGDGGYIVGPGSEINGKEYEIIIDKLIAEANDEVYKFIENGHQSRPIVNISDNGTIQVGTRNNILFNIGYSLHSEGVSEDIITSSLYSINDSQCAIPLPEDEVNKIIHSIIKYKQKHVKEVNYAKTWESAAEKKAKPKKGNTDVVEGLIPIGVTIVAAPPKMGKTFFCMELCNCVASGKDFIGYKTKKYNAYYLALEDPEDLQIDKLQNNFDEVSNDYDIELLPAYNPNFNLKEKIINYMHYNNNLKVVVIDTFEKTRDISKERKYAIEYNEISYYHELAIHYNIAIILVMHSIKNIRKEDPFSNISGSAGVQASADSMLLLLQSESDTNNYILCVNGKNIVKNELFLKKTDKCGFNVIETKIDDPYIDPDLQAIISYVISNGTYCGPAEKLGVNAKTASVNGNHIRSLLDRNRETLKSFFISYKVLDRTTSSRKLELKYFGEEPIQ